MNWCWISGRVEPESELYFGDASSFTVSIHNDNCNGSAMYEEIQGHRYDTLQRPANDNMVGQRSSWDGHSQRLPSASGIHGGQSRSRHSADTVGKAKIFSPIVVPKFVNCPSSGASSWVLLSFLGSQFQFPVLILLTNSTIRIWKRSRLKWKLKRNVIEWTK